MLRVRTRFKLESGLTPPQMQHFFSTIIVGILFILRKIGAILGWIKTYLLLTIIYFAIIGPYKVLQVIFKTPRTLFPKKAKTNWKVLHIETNIDALKRQF